MSTSPTRPEVDRCPSCGASASKIVRELGFGGHSITVCLGCGTDINKFCTHEVKSE